MKKTSEEGGVACGLCSVNLQQASLGFGVADVTHAIVGVAVMMSMILKQENDSTHEKEKLEKSPEKMTGYTKFVKECPVWVMHLLLAAFILQITLGLILCIGASNRSSTLCSLWGIASFLASPLTPITYCLLGLGRIYEWAAVGEWVFKMDQEELQYRNGNSGQKKEDFYAHNENNGEDDIISF